jgi:hypothetical protein
LNAALRVQLLNRFGPGAHLIEVDEPPRSDRLIGLNGKARLPSLWRFRRDALLRVLEELLAQHEYAAANRVFEKALRKEELEGLASTSDLLRHADARFRLDFKAAVDALDRQVHRTGQSAQWRNSAGADLLSAQRLVELIDTAAALLSKEDYGGFVVRAAMINETALRQLASLLTGVRFAGRTVNRRRLSGTHLEPLREANVPLQTQSILLNRKVYTILIREALKKAEPDVKEAAQVALSRINSLTGLAELRNRFVHEARCSAEDVVNAFPQCRTDFRNQMTHLLDAMRSVRRRTATDGHVVDNLYGRLNTAILNAIKQGPKRTGGSSDSRRKAGGPRPKGITSSALVQ